MNRPKMHLVPGLNNLGKWYEKFETSKELDEFLRRSIERMKKKGKVK
jgi:hypothetical protein